ncbi:EAL domain-containing protein [Cyanobium sp. Morenito 9A2]|uniref:EAL domain-containing protein n=1 Tax=Cyanobium sp. Morenito 9A2 TaxID=2823718 RepID=UPI0020CBEF44|nr:EAL domain-containing protein [Cyanobium sp. Morenito 9A2]MCP9851008.1 EAL domain-containing protein [Cyanobium sp. Morenito 9A2]
MAFTLQPVVALATERVVGGDLVLASLSGAGREERACEAPPDGQDQGHDALGEGLLKAFALADRWQNQAWISAGLSLGALGSGRALWAKLSCSVADLDGLRRRVGHRLLIRSSLEGAAAAASFPLLNQLGEHQGLAIELRLEGKGTLAQLLRLNVDRLLLPASLVQGIDADGRRQRLVRWLVAGCQQSAVEVCAQGVESRSQAAWLREQGVELASGPLWGSPLPPADFEVVLKRGVGLGPDVSAPLMALKTVPALDR